MATPIDTIADLDRGLRTQLPAQIQPELSHQQHPIDDDDASWLARFGQETETFALRASQLATGIHGFLARPIC